MKNILLFIKSVTIFFMVLLNAILFAQAPDTLWTRLYGGSKSDFGNSVQQTTDGGYIVIGFTSSFGAGSNDVWLIKTDGSGDTLWTRTFGKLENESGILVQQTTDSGYIIIGKIGRWDGVWLIKTDSSGDTLWTKIFRGRNYAWGNYVQQTSDGGYIIAASLTELPTFTPVDLWLIKTDSIGDTLWTETFRGIYSGSVQQTSDEGYIITGSTRSDVSGDDVWLMKTDKWGDSLWSKTYGRMDHDSGNSVKQTFDGGFIIAGTTRSDVSGDDIWLIKTDSIGDTLWTKTFGGIDGDWGNSVQQTSDGGYIITGTTRSFGAGNDDVWLIKTDAEGDTLWTKTFGGSNYDWSGSVQQTFDGGYIITGTFDYSGASGSGDVWLIKVAPDITAIEEKPQSVISDYQLHQNYPNPFNPTTAIEFALPKSSFVTLKIYNLLGEAVATLIAEQRAAGIHKFNWDARGLASGVYVYRLEAGEFVQTKKLILMR